MSIPLKKYVLGFAFSSNRRELVLINKNRPDWQKGLLNGVGGSVDYTITSDGYNYQELPLIAMIREFEEETGVVIQEAEWKHFTTLHSMEYEVYCYKVFTDEIYKVETKTDEKVLVYDIRYLNNLDDPKWAKNLTISNLKVLIPLALAEDINHSKLYMDMGSMIFR